MSARNVIELLDKAVDDLFDRMPGVTPEMRAKGRAHYMITVALDLCHILAEETHEQWDPAALREALRDILAACRHARDAKVETTDRMIGDDEDRQGLARMLGLAEDADVQVVMAALARFNAGGAPGGDSPPDAAPA